MAEPQVDEFELMRRRIQQKGGVRADDAQRQLQRRFAALGNLDSGVALQQTQQLAQAQEDQTNLETQDVNALQAQTMRAERQAEADRTLQRYGIDTGAATSKYGVDAQTGASRYAADLGAKSAMDVAGLGAQTTLGVTGLQEAGATGRAQIGATSALDVAKLGSQTNLGVANIGAKSALDVAGVTTGAQKDIANIQEAGATGRAMIGADSAERVAKMGNENARAIANLEAETGINMQKVSLDQAMTLAKMDQVLKQDGNSITRMLADSQIAKDQQEMVINTTATLLNSFAPLMQAGFKPYDVSRIVAQVTGLDMGGVTAMIDKMYSDKQAPVSQPTTTPSKSPFAHG
jgi:hypothetical protein